MKVDSAKIIKEYLGAVAEAKGQEMADKTELYYERGWFWYNPAVKYPDGSIGPRGWPYGQRSKDIIVLTNFYLGVARKNREGRP
ncbi:hypothetical protein LCGC14_0498730 [marine sediment metagenome]|uniref:Uncharacterized protein n=1 Tax=marine sediment metagenome TaxID=412755 RepID=A0A0F9S9U4_9ZZZZ